MHRLFLFLAAVALASCGTIDRPEINRGLVSAADPRAAEAGAEMLRAGGSAADAALATLVALTVVEPQSSGVGGGGFLLYDDGSTGLRTYDGRETAPMAAGGNWFLQDGKPMPFLQAVTGGKSVGVPGNLRLMALAHRQHGRLPWARLFDPAIRIARDGFAITPRLHQALDRFRATGALSAEGRALFYGSDGQPLPVGTIVRNPALANSFAELARRGPDSFYVGPNAAAIIATVNRAPQNPSRMTGGDLAAYEAKARDPVCAVYRRHRICSMGPPSSGATTVIAILAQLERFDLGRLGPQSPTSWHLIGESMRLAYADRDLYLADPDFVAVPLPGLLDSGYIASRSALISPDRAIAAVTAGTPVGAARVRAGLQPAEAGTSHMVAVDRRGAVASLTSTIEGPFGSGLVTGGYYLNNELTDFSFLPVKDGAAVANRVEAGKRPRSSMAPTIVYGPGGKVRLAIGAAGGATIIAQVAKAIIGVIDWNLPAQQAIALPVLFAPGEVMLLEGGTSLEALAPSLRTLGHKVELREPTFKANAIERREGKWIGAADPRSEGAVASE
jgi:gamma-glutamyltranspeptidase/glutathione hydrolase